MLIVYLHAKKPNTKQPELLPTKQTLNYAAIKLLFRANKYKISSGSNQKPLLCCMSVPMSVLANKKL